jgi:hypothetical protein
VTQLYIAKGGSKPTPKIPIDAVTRTFGIFGQRGTGKTNTAVVMAEEMCRKGGHAAIFDPVGAWWGITRDGEGKGLPGIVIGGEHGDVPLEETGGQLVAELIIARHWPVVVVDMKLLRKGAQLRFLADCLEALYFGNRLPLHVFFEEADRALPQSPRGMDPTMGRVLGAAEDIFKLGRGRGLGSTLVSQRFATVNKNVTEQVETMVLHRMIGPNDRKAAKAWIESNGDPALTERVLNAMAKQKLGEAVLYSPGWLDIFETIRVRERKTFDSSATPEVGAQLAEPTKRAPVDLDALRTAMTETIERAKANDPAELRKRIRELEEALEAAIVDQVEREVEVEVLVPDRAAIAQLSQLTGEMQGFLDDIREEMDGAADAINAKLEVVREVRGEAQQQLEAIREVLDKVGGMGRTRVETAPRSPEGSTRTRPRPEAAGRDKPASAPPRPAASSNGTVSWARCSACSTRSRGCTRSASTTRRRGRQASSRATASGRRSAAPTATCSAS